MYRLSLAEALSKTLAEVDAMTVKEQRLWAAYFRKREKDREDAR